MLLLRPDHTYVTECRQTMHALILYDAKFWREKFFAKLGNYNRYTKILLSKSRSIQYSQPAKLCLEIEQHTVIIKINRKFYRPESSYVYRQQLAGQPVQFNTHKIAKLLLLCNVSAIRQPKVHLSNLNSEIELTGRDPKLLQVFVISIYKPLPPLVVPQLVSYIVILHGQTVSLYRVVITCSKSEGYLYCK